jgi:octaprenyl-diphosphate synthase
MQFTASKDTSTTEDIYMRIIQAKTAALFAASTEVSAVIAECDTHETAALASYGHNVGIVFQLVDDALDYCGRIIALGKSIGNDFHECKVTLPVILAFQRGSIKERAFWRRTLQQGKQKNGDLEHAKALMTRYNAIEDTIFRAKSYGAIAKDALKIFPESHYRQVLIDIVDFCINRTY